MADGPRTTGDLAFYTALSFLLNRVPPNEEITPQLLTRLVAQALQLATHIRAELERQSGESQ